MNEGLFSNNGIGRIACAGLLLLGFGGCGNGGGGGGDGSADAGPDPTAVGSPIAWYRFDDEVTSDSSGEGHDATCETECPEVVPFGRVGSAAAFDGSEYMTVGDDGALSTPEGYTVAAWVRIDDLDRRFAVFTKKLGSGSRNSWALTVDRDGVPSCYTSSAAEGNDNLHGDDAIEEGKWHHLACSWDGSVKRIYVDGSMGGTAEVQSSFDESPIVIGGDIDNEPDFLLEGFVDEAMLFDYALEPEKIASLAERGSPAPADGGTADGGTPTDGGE